MASNSFGHLFKVTTWGESHGKAIGVVIDGCPPNLEIDEQEINIALALRAPGKSPYTSPRIEKDQVKILSGVFEGFTTGASISMIILNKDIDSSKYEPIKDLLRPGHANYSYLEKYGIFDYRGGGRSSARETACRVAAGAIAKKILSLHDVKLIAYIQQIGNIHANPETNDFSLLRTSTDQSPVFCPDPHAASAMMTLIETAKKEGDSLGGIVKFIAQSYPSHEKLEAHLADAMLSLPATKGFEIESNYSPLLIGKVAFKPTSSIMKIQETLTLSKEQATFQLPAGSRHDPCVAIRAVPIVEAMAALVLADILLLNKCRKNDYTKRNSI